MKELIIVFVSLVVAIWAGTSKTHGKELSRGLIPSPNSVSAYASVPHAQETISYSKDSDGDGIPDDEDKCPLEPGSKENKGCPKITVEMWTLFHKELSDVKFVSNSDSLTKGSYPALKRVAKLMKGNSGYILKVSGFADSLGQSEYNKELSYKRSQAVKKELVKQGVAEHRIKLAAFGEQMPKAPNNTVQGRAENRRVEFDLFY